MLPYLESFNHDDRERVFRFLATFSRWECALKHNNYVRRGSYGQAEADWKKFANTHKTQFAGLQTPEFIKARNMLITNPPKREELQSTEIKWEPNPRRGGEIIDADYLLRVVRDVRNNLFHGGKFAGGPAQELARDRELIDSATAVLEITASMHEGIKAMLDQTD